MPSMALWMYDSAFLRSSSGHSTAHIHLPLVHHGASTEPVYSSMRMLQQQLMSRGTMVTGKNMCKEHVFVQAGPSPASVL
jgi:hypothetical protein